MNIRLLFDISPLVAPIDGTKGWLPVWGEDAKIYQKLPTFVAEYPVDGNNYMMKIYENRRRHTL